MTVSRLLVILIFCVECIENGLFNATNAPSWNQLLKSLHGHHQGSDFEGSAGHYEVTGFNVTDMNSGQSSLAQSPSHGSGVNKHASVSGKSPHLNTIGGHSAAGNQNPHASSAGHGSAHCNQTGHGATCGNTTHHPSAHHGVNHHLVTWVSAACMLIFIIGAGYLFLYVYGRMRKNESKDDKSHMISIDLAKHGSSATLVLSKSAVFKCKHSASQASLPPHYHVTFNHPHPKHPQRGVDWTIGEEKLASNNSEKPPQTITRTDETATNFTAEQSETKTKCAIAAVHCNASLENVIHEEEHHLPDYTTATTSEIYKSVPEEEGYDEAAKISHESAAQKQDGNV